MKTTFTEKTSSDNGSIWVTLSEFIKELQELEKEHGEDKVLSIGSYCGCKPIDGKHNPYSIKLSKDGLWENSDDYFVTRYKNTTAPFFRNK